MGRLNHQKVFELCYDDPLFVADLKASGQKLPRFKFLTDTLEAGIWASAYAGWILGKFGPEVYKTKMEYWRTL